MPAHSVARSSEGQRLKGFFDSLHLLEMTAWRGKEVPLRGTLENASEGEAFLYFAPPCGSVLLRP